MGTNVQIATGILLPLLMFTNLHDNLLGLLVKFLVPLLPRSNLQFCVWLKLGGSCTIIGELFTYN